MSKETLGRRTWTFTVGELEIGPDRRISHGAGRHAADQRFDLSQRELTVRDAAVYRPKELLFAIPTLFTRVAAGGAVAEVVDDRDAQGMTPRPERRVDRVECRMAKLILQENVELLGVDASQNLGDACART